MHIQVILSNKGLPVNLKFQKNGKLQKNENEKNENDDVYLVEKNLLVSSNYSWCFYNVLNLSNYNDNENNKNDNNDHNKYENKNISTCVGDLGYDELTGQILIGILNNDNANNLKLYQSHIDNSNNNNSTYVSTSPNVIMKRLAHHTLRNLYNNDSSSTYVSTSVLQLWHDNSTSPLATSSSKEHSKPEEHSLNPKEHSFPYIPSKTIHMSITHNKYPFSGTPVSVIDKNVDICCEITVVKMVYALTKKNSNYDYDYNNEYNNNNKNNVNSENLIRVVSASPPAEGTHVYLCVCVCVCVSINTFIYIFVYTYIYIYIYKYVYICIYTYIYMYVNTFGTYTCICMYACTWRSSMYGYIYIHKCLYLHI
jgi:hypothetical protein